MTDAILTERANAAEPYDPLPCPSRTTLIRRVVESVAARGFTLRGFYTEEVWPSSLQTYREKVSVREALLLGTIPSPPWGGMGAWEVESIRSRADTVILTVTAENRDELAGRVASEVLEMLSQRQR